MKVGTTTRDSTLKVLLSHLSPGSQGCDGHVLLKFSTHDCALVSATNSSKLPEPSARRCEGQFA